MDIFNNREIAIGIWSVILLGVCALLKPARDSLFVVIRILWSRIFLMQIGAMSLYIVLIVFLLSEIGLWDISQLKTTVFWALTTGGVSFARVTSTPDDQEFFRNLLKDIFKITLVIEFVVAFYTFSLIAELLFLPFMAFVGLMAAFAQGKEEHQVVERFFNGILVGAGLLVLGYSGYRLIFDPQDFFTLSTLKDFYLPPLLSFLFLPHLFFLVMYIAYEKVFFLVDIHVKNENLRNYTKLQAMIGFVSDRELLRRWSQTLITNPIKEKTDVARSIERTFELKQREENPPNVSLKDGWSPYVAGKFLDEHGLEAGPYKQIIEDLDEWQSSSDIFKLGDYIFENTITYFVCGSEHVATCLEILLEIGAPEAAEPAMAKFVESGALLYEKSLCSEMPINLRNAMIAGKSFESIADGKEILVTRKDWSIDNSYTLKLFIRNPEGTRSNILRFED